MVSAGSPASQTSSYPFACCHACSDENTFLVSSSPAAQPAIWLPSIEFIAENGGGAGVRLTGAQ